MPKEAEGLTLFCLGGEAGSDEDFYEKFYFGIASLAPTGNRLTGINDP